MPTYEYECGRCFHRFELFQSISAKPVRKCPGCSRASARRLISAGAALLFKGSGFYITDYRSADYKSKAKADQEASKPATKPAEGAAAPASPSGASGSPSPASPAAASAPPANTGSSRKSGSARTSASKSGAGEPAAASSSAK